MQTEVYTTFKQIAPGEKPVTDLEEIPIMNSKVEVKITGPRRWWHKIFGTTPDEIHLTICPNGLRIQYLPTAIYFIERIKITRP